MLVKSSTLSSNMTVKELFKEGSGEINELHKQMVLMEELLHWPMRSQCLKMLVFWL